jgi:predicted lipase
MVYEPEAQLKSWTCAKCNLYQFNDRSTWYEKSKNLFGMIGYSPKLKAIVIAFRGTQSKSKENIATDLNFDDVDYSNCNGCKVHKGFYEAFRLQQKLVEQNLNRLVKKYPNTPIHVTGHSLGGAIATITAAHLSLNKKYKLAQVYTFGEPRVGNKKFADWFDSRITEYRVIHFKDIVPNLPPRNNYIKRILGAHYLNSKSLHSMRLQSHQGLWNFEYHREGT